MTTPKTYRAAPGVPAGSVIGDDPSAVFESTLTVYSPDGARCREVVALVDTRSLHSIIPAEVLLELGIEPVIESRFNYRDGSILKLPVGPARVALPGKAGHSIVAFGKDPQQTIIGGLTLVELALAADPKNKRFVPGELTLLRCEAAP